MLCAAAGFDAAFMYALKQGPSLAGRATAQIMAEIYIYAAVRNVCFMDALSCRQKIMDTFTSMLCDFQGGGAEDVHIVISSL